MSYLAIGSVTRAIAQLLALKLNRPPLLGSSTPLRVTTLPPDDARIDTDDGVNLFLYRIAESPFAKNLEWRGTPLHPGHSRRPPLALTLSYLMTAYAKKGDGIAQDDIVAHQILGNALGVLHEHPVLNAIHDGDFDADLDLYLAAELRDSFETIKLVPLPISTDELSKIWTGFSKAYRLSVAYEVSLVQLAPLEPPARRGPPTQRVSLSVDRAGKPQMASLSPSSGPVGSEITIRGRGFRPSAGQTSVKVAGETISEPDFVRLSDEEIVLRIPEAPSRGPALPVIVIAGGRESDAAQYEVAPWIESLSPLRGISGIPLAIPFEVPSGATLSASVGGLTAPVSVNAAEGQVRVTVPDAVPSNGSQAVVLRVSGAETVRTNALLYELLPVITSVSIAEQTAPVRTTITISGLRLNGDVHVKLGRLRIARPANPSATQVVVAVDRLLPPAQPISVLVDGRESNPLPPRLDRIEPPRALPGESIKLVGVGLSGTAVSVVFAGTSVSLGAQAGATQIVLPVPAGLAAGALAMRATVNGNDTNSLPFTVLA